MTRRALEWIVQTHFANRESRSRSATLANPQSLSGYPGAFLDRTEVTRILGKFFINDQLLYALISTIYIAVTFSTDLTDMRGIGHECGFEGNACAVNPDRSICIFRVI
jgi:hypothetical protein